MGKATIGVKRLQALIDRAYEVDQAAGRPVPQAEAKAAHASPNAMLYRDEKGTTVEVLAHGDHVNVYFASNQSRWSEMPIDAVETLALHLDRAAQIARLANQ